MSHLLFWSIFVVVLSYIAVVLDRRWEKIQLERQVTAEIPVTQAITATLTNASETITGFATRLVNQWQHQRNGHHQPVNIPTFRAWLSSLFPPSALEQGWLSSLTDEQIQILHKGVATFAEDLGFDLAWLLAAQPFKHPTVEQAAKEIVLNYLRAWQQATQVQQDVQEMKHYQALLANPLLPANQQLAHQLHAHLVKEKLAAEVAPEVRAAGEQAEQAFLLQSLQVVATQQPTAFSRALKITIAVNKATTQAAATTTASVAMPEKA